MAVEAFTTEIQIQHKGGCQKDMEIVHEFDKTIQRNVWRCTSCNRRATAVVDENIYKEFKDSLSAR